MFIGVVIWTVILIIVTIVYCVKGLPSNGHVSVEQMFVMLDSELTEIKARARSESMSRLAPKNEEKPSLPKDDTTSSPALVDKKSV